MWQARGRDSKGEVALACDGLGSARLGWLAGGGLALRWAGRGEMMMPTRRRGVDSARAAKLYPTGNFGGFCCSCLLVDPRLRLRSPLHFRQSSYPPPLLRPAYLSVAAFAVTGFSQICTYKMRKRKF